MELWVVITIASAFLQNMRSVFQKHLKGQMGTTAATFVRFGFGVPFAILYLAILHLGLGHPLPVPNGAFFAWGVIGGLAQIGATFLLVHLFSFRNFAVGTAYSRTEPMQAALIAYLFLGERLNANDLVALCLSMAGVMLISVARTDISPRSLLESTFSRTARIGLLSGLLFGLSAVAYSSASGSLAAGLPARDAAMQAGFTLVYVILLQTAVMLGWLAWREPGEIRRIRSAWRVSLATGFVGATASFGWFTAMTLQQAALVRSLAQIEMVFTFASTALVFKERVNRLEVVGCALIVSGILLLFLL
ncbi:DMT family transporter [Gellertiella hungarica]|uniref:Drug/metabolite transporter (DMT)-like permease n=1 Tax=Gellertiella hungarica TaxID=1572859 RepID=A0A7W6NJU0_9HYPH|nr:DMT family transporter [Gellertiella hungarica]MBB4063834.1 drug/metabolite transporter (DMT)-like permease [Gellertiella hungarica]